MKMFNNNKELSKENLKKFIDEHNIIDKSTNMGLQYKGNTDLYLILSALGQIDNMKLLENKHK